MRFNRGGDIQHLRKKDLNDPSVEHGAFPIVGHDPDFFVVHRGRSAQAQGLGVGAHIVGVAGANLGVFLGAHEAAETSLAEGVGAVAVGAAGGSRAESGFAGECFVAWHVGCGGRK